MHLKCSGVVKKMILLWTKGPLSVRLNLRSINKISYLLTLLKTSTPNEFVRRSRSINDVKLESCRISKLPFIYGSYRIKICIKKKIYYHFITLHVAITIFTRPNLYQENFINYAEALLNNFVKSFEIL